MSEKEFEPPTASSSRRAEWNCGIAGSVGRKYLQRRHFLSHAGIERETQEAGGRSGPSWQQDMAIYRMFPAGATGLEPATSGVTGRRSNQLNYAPVERGTV